MTTRTSALEVDLATVVVNGATAATVVALPPSSLDLYGGGGYGSYASGYYGPGGDEMRVYPAGALVRRRYDPDITAIGRSS